MVMVMVAAMAMAMAMAMRVAMVIAIVMAIVIVIVFVMAGSDKVGYGLQCTHDWLLSKEHLDMMPVCVFIMFIIE